MPSIIPISFPYEIKHSCIALSMVMCLFFCNRQGKRVKEKLIAEVLAQAGKNMIVDIASLTDFDWERMYFLNSDSGMQEKQVSSIICGNGWSLGAHTKAVFFLTGREVVGYF